MQITITPGTIVTTVLILLGFWLLFYLGNVVLTVVAAIIIASGIEPATARLVRIGLPRILAVVSIYLFALLVLLLLVSVFMPPLVSETRSFVDALPQYLDEMNLTSPVAIDETQTITQKLLQFQEVLSASRESLANTLVAIFGSIFSFILIVVLSFYLAVQEGGLTNFLRTITPLQKQDYILDLWRRAQVKMGRWLQGQILLSAIVGILVYPGLVLLGVPYALLLAIAAAMLELIPVFGSIIAAIPAVLLAFVAPDGGVATALFTILLYVVVNQLQGNVIYPLVVQKVLGLPPLVVILAIIVGAQIGALFGSWFLGVLLSVPIAAAVQEYVNDLQKGRNRLQYVPAEGAEEPTAPNIQT